MAEIFNVHEAKSNLSALLAKVEAGETVTIARNGDPVADLVPHTKRAIRRTLDPLPEFAGLELRWSDEESVFDDPDYVD